MKKQKSHLLLVKLCGLCVTLISFIYFHSISMQSSQQQEDLSSSSEKIGRPQVNFGVPVPSDKSPKDELSVLMKDPSVHQKWGLVATDAKKAWRVTKGSKDIIVAVIDTGVDVRHPELQSSLWVNKGESGTDKFGRNKMNNGIDDDGNGFIDDIYGWNFVDNNNNVSDVHGHGTHIAGIIGASGINNGHGFSGISPQVSIMVLKYYDARDPSSTLRNTVKAIDYAVDHGANIINYSGGGLDPSPAEKHALERAEQKGILVVAAAGNERSNSDLRAYYPADYGLSNIISVTAIDKTLNVLPSSNYGVKSVDIAAPGNEIYSTLPGGRYGYLTGTSQATAFVSGVAALVMANNRELNAQEVIKYLTRTGDVEAQLDGKTRYRRRLNSYRALTTLDQGVAATGVIATNTSGMNQEMFSSEPLGPEQAGPAASIT